MMPNSQDRDRATVQQTGSIRQDEWSQLLVAVGTQRNRAAFERLFAHYAPQIKGFQIKQGGRSDSYEAGEELVQEVMFRVWTRAPGYDPSRASANTWIYTIMRNCRVDALRRQACRPGLDEGLAVEDVWDEALDEQPLVYLQQYREQSSISAALGELPEEQSQVIEKAFVEGKSHQEISSELGLPLGTVKSRVRLGLKKLQGALAGKKSQEVKR